MCSYFDPRTARLLWYMNTAGQHSATTSHMECGSKLLTVALGSDFTLGLTRQEHLLQWGKLSFGTGEQRVERQGDGAAQGTAENLCKAPGGYGRSVRS